MTQIKSAKALELLDKDAVRVNLSGSPLKWSCHYVAALKAVIIAESEADERHAKELQELKDKAVTAFCFCGTCGNISSQVLESETCPFKTECEDRKSFIQKLNEK